MSELKYRVSKYWNKIIAIDGPAGSGKSTTARKVAEHLGYTYLDTGAMYRALTLFALKHCVSPSDGQRLTVLARNLLIEFRDANRVFLNGEDVTEEIRTPDVTLNVSEVSAHRGVREAMVAKQQELAKNGSVVAEGRDTTTVVFPDAHLKVYLDASIQQRAQRRLIELSRAGQTTTLDEQIADIKRRDQYDSSRKHSPLTRAQGVYSVDTSNCTIEDQVERVLSLFKALVK